MNNQYFGATIEQRGGSALYSKALLNISEGYLINGVTTLVNLGDFETNDFRNEGSLTQVLDVDLVSKDQRVNTNSSFFDRSFDSQYLSYQRFWTSDMLSSNYSILSGNWGVCNDLGGILTTPGSAFIIQSQNTSLKDVRVMSLDPFASSVSSTVEGICFKTQTTTNNNGDPLGYIYRVTGTAAQLLCLTQSGTTILNSTGLSFGGGPLWLVASVFQNRIRCGYTFNFAGTSIVTLISLTDSTYSSGAVGMYFAGNTNAVYTNHVFDVAEIKNNITNKEVVTSAYAMSGVYKVNIANDVDSISTLTPSTGSSWVLGNSNNYFLNHTTSGNSWHTLTTQGASLSNFVVEFEMRGTSNSQNGIMVGVSQLFYGNYYCFVPARGATPTNVISLSTLSGVTYKNTYLSGMGDHINLIPDTWYKMKVVKNGLFMGVYINGVFANGTYGISATDIFGPSMNSFSSVDFGILSPSASNGSTSEFRNFQISQLSQTIDDVHLSPNESIQALTSRYLPQGFGSVWHQNQIDIFRIGSSRGVHDVGLSTFPSWNTHARSNTYGKHIVSINGTNFIGQYINLVSTLTNQLDSLRTDFINDQSVANSNQANDLARASTQYDNLQIEQFTIVTTARVDLELYDTVNFVDQKLGISSSYIVYNFTKNYVSKTSEFINQITLGL